MTLRVSIRRKNKPGRKNLVDSYKFSKQFLLENGIKISQSQYNKIIYAYMNILFDTVLAGETFVSPYIACKIVKKYFNLPVIKTYPIFDDDGTVKRYSSVKDNFLYYLTSMVDIKHVKVRLPPRIAGRLAVMVQDEGADFEFYDSLKSKKFTQFEKLPKF